MQSVVDRLEDALLARLDNSRSPLVFGLCGAQGSGKSTAASGLQDRLAGRGLRSVVLSLDDLYHPRAERLRLASEVHRLLVTRGPPGTHDTGLGIDVLMKLRAGQAVQLPRFDKAADDRSLRDCWPRAEKVDVVIFEGWFVGARAQAADACTDPLNALERVEDADGRWRTWTNKRLATDYQRLFAQIDCLALLAAPEFGIVERWRAEQEAGLLARLNAAGQVSEHTMSSEQLRRFVSFFERLTRHILDEMPARADICIRLDDERRPLD